MRLVALLAVGMFALGLDAYVLAGLLPSIGMTFGTPVAAVAQIVTAFTLSYALLSPALAVVSASLDRRIVLLVGLCVFALANLGSVLAPSLGLLMLTRVVAGAAAGLYAPSAAATAAGLVPAASRGKALAVVLGGLTAATVFGVPIGLVIAAQVGWRATLLLVAVLAIVAAVGLGLGLPSVSAPVPGLRERLAILSHRAVLGRIAVMLLAASASLGLYTYLAPLLAHLAHLGSGELPAYFLLWGVAGTLGNAASGWLLDRGVGADRILTVGLVGLAAALAAFPVLGHSAVGVAALVAVWGASVWSLQVPIQHQLARIAPEHASTVIALLASSIYLGSAIGSGLGAVVLTASIGFLAPAAAVAALAALVVHVWTAPGSAGSRRSTAAPAAADDPSAIP